jgi:hypothetical protein
LVIDNLVLFLHQRQSTMKPKVRYDVIDNNVVRETVTTQRDEPVNKIIFPPRERAMIMSAAAGRPTTKITREPCCR